MEDVGEPEFESAVPDVENEGEAEVGLVVTTVRIVEKPKVELAVPNDMGERELELKLELSVTDTEDVKGELELKFELVVNDIEDVDKPELELVGIEIELCPALLVTEVKVVGKLVTVVLKTEDELA